MGKNEQMRFSDRKRQEMDFQFPEIPMNIVLVYPSIPPNTGNVSRLCAATGSRLHLIEPLGFNIDDRAVRRAGLDYWDSVDLHVYPDFGTFLEKNSKGRKFFFSTAGKKIFHDAAFEPGDFLIFGNETYGLPDEIIDAQPSDQVLNIPIRLDNVRSLNLSNCAAVVLFEALRQINA
ncbi:tRNA (cytidine(34)-2'-O)-methyltransferase [Pontiella agarivorans]|uniref:Putative tRNA (cytidine(34)-2'-O)-methyltransferase n=1 Tax=Pontiella agarivorans TaxID=3038953 RepID=A0ABU5MYK0_9BACT|nr:tRNA (cytidine(34)-2'-O)-methyltransferase [Pontiella agarivorans]MDZ8119252.1 tRNA (cytidine(34)-2'-O)-methyltransferase [Pontiella agarivorans]